MSFAVASHRNPDGTDQWTLTVTGELDLAAAPEFWSAIAEIGMSTSTVVLVDLAGVEFIDSSGIRSVVEAARALSDAGGRLVLGPTSPTVKRVLELTGLTAVLRPPAQPES
jgi:anti-anti-sigma factor